VAIKINKKVEFRDSIPKEFTKFAKIKKPINILSDDAIERIGYITLYFDESLIINQINELKAKTKKEIENFNTEIKTQQQKSNSVKIYIAIGSLITILALLYTLLMYFVNSPLHTVQAGLDEFFLFLQNKKDNTKRIELNSNDEFGQMAKSLNENISVSAKLHEEIHELNTNLEVRIIEKTTKVTTLLNNADQGFLTFGGNLIIDSEYSKQCTTIFKKEISGLNIADLLYSNEKKKEFFIQTLQSLLTETSELKIKTIISLLQKEFIINKKAIEIKYKIVDDGKFMLMLTDITAKKILEKKINREKNILKMIVSIVSDSDEFFELYDEFNEFINIKDTLIDNDKTALHNATELYRIIHTFKGLFSQKEMQNIVLNLHKLESALSDCLANQSNTNQSLEELIHRSDFEAWLQKDINIIKDVLGDELFSKRGKVTVQEETLSQIENKIIEISNKYDEINKYEEVVNDIKNLKNKTLQSMFASYPKLIDQLSQNLEKSIYPLEVIVDKELRVSDNIKPFIKSLVHVFRNSVDHGIETMDERHEIQKDEIGTISCSIKEDENNLHFIIADDGAGIDIEKIKEKATQLEIDTDSLSDNEIEALIFNDRFSTKGEVSQTSGRGVGMAVVKYEIEKINGVININSQLNIGTTFEFIIPL
jgi:two-component system chemotaxis sensor kinase CheA